MSWRLTSAGSIFDTNTESANPLGARRHMSLTIIGRSSSHFTRTARMFAHECGIEYQFKPVLDLMSRAAADYGNNPALRLPVLETAEGPLFGALNICRELVRRGPQNLRVIWPEQLKERAALNAQELVLQGMSSEVLLIMSGTQPAGSYADKARLSLTNTLAWLDARLPDVLRALPPERMLSFLEVSCFCFITHLEFRQVLDISEYSKLRSFCQAYAGRKAALDTAYAFDAP
jgi:glutathione S-transferase